MILHMLDFNGQKVICRSVCLGKHNIGYQQGAALWAAKTLWGARLRSPWPL